MAIQRMSRTLRNLSILDKVLPTCNRARANCPTMGGRPPGGGVSACGIMARWPSEFTSRRRGRCRASRGRAGARDTIPVRPPVGSRPGGCVTMPGLESATTVKATRANGGTRDGNDRLPDAVWVATPSPCRITPRRSSRGRCPTRSRSGPSPGRVRRCPRPPTVPRSDCAV